MKTESKQSATHERQSFTSNEVPSFTSKVCGKWILAGEHTVLRDGKALVFPFKQAQFSMAYWASDHPLVTSFCGKYGDEARLIFWGVFRRAAELVDRTESAIGGRIDVMSELPIGAGLGASASLCVAVARWCQFQNWIKASELQSFSQELENLFHGKSSGVDVASVIAARPIVFQVGSVEDLRMLWQPKWYLSYSGQRGATSECVRKVMDLRNRDPDTFLEIDQDMRVAVRLAQEALSEDEERGVEKLCHSIDKARSCFERWGLVNGRLSSHIHSLVEKGAWAVKPTGSGEGGYVLSLWRHEPPPDLKDVLRPAHY